MSARAQKTVDHETARARFIHEHERLAERLEFAHRPAQRGEISADGAVMADLTSRFPRGQINGILVHVHSDKQFARLAHGLPPLLG